MKINELKITNFRGIENLEIRNFDEHCNVIVGINGAGKTTVLDAIAYLFSWQIARIKNSNGRGTVLQDCDVNLKAKQGAIEIKVCEAYRWSLSKLRAYQKKNEQSGCQTDLTELMTFVDSIQANGNNGESIPVLMYYPVERAIASAPVNLHKGTEPVVWDAYKDALKGNANFRSFFEWYRRQEDIESEYIRDDRNYQDKSLKAIREAMHTFFPEFGGMRVRRRPFQALVVEKNGKTIEFTQLSQGEKCYLSLICDIARRLAIANPNVENPLQGEGVVLIDEVDLHLHPKWQSEIASKLVEVFPNCQFILSTHSPQVLSDLRREQIIPLDKGMRKDISFNPYGQLTSTILTNYFDVSAQRNKVVSKDIEAAFKAIEDKDRDEFTRLFTKIKATIGGFDRDVVDLLLEAKRKGVYDAQH